MMKAVPQIRPHPIPTRIRAQALHLRPLRIQAPRIPILIPLAAAMPVNEKEGHKNLLKKVRQRKQTVKKASRISFRSTWPEPKKSDAEEVENKENCITKNMMFLKIKNCFFLVSKKMTCFVFSMVLLAFDFLFQGFSTCTCHWKLSSA